MQTKKGMELYEIPVEHVINDKLKHTIAQKTREGSKIAEFVIFCVFLDNSNQRRVISMEFIFVSMFYIWFCFGSCRHEESRAEFKPQQTNEYIQQQKLEVCFPVGDTSDEDDDNDNGVFFLFRWRHVKHCICIGTNERYL